MPSWRPGHHVQTVQQPLLDFKGAESDYSTHADVVVGVQVLQRLHEAARHVPRFRSLHRCVHQPLPPSHRVEEELRGAETTAGQKEQCRLCLSAALHRRVDLPLPPRQCGEEERGAQAAAGWASFRCSVSLYTPQHTDGRILC